MRLTELIDKWQARLSALRDERDFLINHNFKVEAMAQGKAVQTLWDILNDLETAVADTRSCCWVDNDDYWETECGHAWTLISDGPVENGMNFCPKCGRSLVVETAVPKQETPE